MEPLFIASEAPRSQLYDQLFLRLRIHHTAGMMTRMLVTNPGWSTKQRFNTFFSFGGNCTLSL